MITIVDSKIDANVITHSGKFHADDVFSTVLLEKILKDIKVFRTYEIIEENDGKIYYDIGGGKFDHHHNHNNEIRNEKIPYASFGLLWKHFGYEYLKHFEGIDVEYVFEYIDKKLILGIDACDNGVFYKCDMYDILDVSNIISLFNPRYDEEVSSDEKFIEACNFARIIFDNIVNKAISISKSKKIVEDKINNSHNNMLILDEYVPYREHILNSTNKKADDIYFVIYKSNRCGYMISTLPKTVNNDELRMKFPSEWAGLRCEDFAQVCGINDVIFCHKNLFVAATQSLSSSIELVNKTLKTNK